MVTIKRTINLLLTVNLLVLASIGLFYIPKKTSLAPNTSISLQNETQPIVDNLEPEDSLYWGDINWVKTYITLDKKGLGKVSMIVNCTPIEDHFGIYIRNDVVHNYFARGLYLCVEERSS